VLATVAWNNNTLSSSTTTPSIDSQPVFIFEYLPAGISWMKLREATDIMQTREINW